jgi:hypothetical protein
MNDAYVLFGTGASASLSRRARPGSSPWGPVNRSGHAEVPAGVRSSLRRIGPRLAMANELRRLCDAGDFAVATARVSCSADHRRWPWLPCRPPPHAIP